MKVYVIETHLLGGEQDIAVFDCKESAQYFIDNNNLHGEPEVLSMTVIGKVVDPEQVYTASSYDAEQDLYFFESVYANRADAEQAAGANGLVLHRKLRREKGAACSDG
ncbi:hypothetical protein [Kangiella sp. TOML190]|uniref:hypothetical protein n=1 Tax=Kangiella sp. TOML190 TaxID=2931351 RepID=UPI0020417BB2|nr:hypothetical protein [Kangiella sp. TOML190]